MSIKIHEHQWRPDGTCPCSAVRCAAISRQGGWREPIRGGKRRQCTAAASRDGLCGLHFYWSQKTGPGVKAIERVAGA